VFACSIFAVVSGGLTRPLPLCQAEQIIMTYHYNHSWQDSRVKRQSLQRQNLHSNLVTMRANTPLNMRVQQHPLWLHVTFILAATWYAPCHWYGCLWPFDIPCLPRLSWHCPLPYYIFCTGWGPLFPIKSMRRFSMTPAEATGMFLTGEQCMACAVLCCAVLCGSTPIDCRMVLPQYRELSMQQVSQKCGAP
jgi:hypothetical protein